MNHELKIGMSWERLEEGSPEERAAFGMLTILQGDYSLTAGIDGFIERSRPGPLVSGYHLAEWLACNWWRLTVEPKPQPAGHDWMSAHHLGTVGNGYIWPNITVFSDRERTVLVARPTLSQAFSPFRFTSNWVAVLPTLDFEAALDTFFGQIQGQLRAASVVTTNYDRIIDELRAERTDPKTVRERRIEALLGFDPDECPAEILESFLGLGAQLGQDAAHELAADHGEVRNILSGGELTSIAQTHGAEFRPQEMVSIEHSAEERRSETPAWRRGQRAARALRSELGLGDEPLTNERLAQMCAVSPRVLNESIGAGLAFSLSDEAGRSGRLVLRSKWTTGRRFELARLLGDRLTSGIDERLLPATRAYTYRQKLQRAFAAELLCPFDGLQERLGSDYSADAREDAAHYFQVSELTVTTTLVNHGCMDRDLLTGDLEAAMRDFEPPPQVPPESGGHPPGGPPIIVGLKGKGNFF